jgi:hypothetical protein
MELRLALAAALPLALLACDRGEEPPTEIATTETTEESGEPEPPGPPDAGPIPDDWVATRVAEAHDRMEQTEAGDLVWQCIRTHGGLESWLAQGTIAFDFDYRPIGSPERRMHTAQKIDLWRARALHEELEGGAGAEATFGWDGERAWIAPGPDAFPSPARFWALTPYYFVGMPFVVADPGTRYELLENAELDGETYRLVKITYEEGTGDSPDDYYILYIHPESYELAALRYVVAYPGFFPEGGHTPEKLMRYTDYRRVGELQIAQTLDTYAWSPGEDGEPGSVGEKVTEITVADLSMGDEWPADVFAPVDGAEISTEIEPRGR